MEGVYAAWTGQPAVLQLTTEGVRVSLRGVIVGESEAAIRFRLSDDLVIDIFKNMILAVEEDIWAAKADARLRGFPSKAGSHDRHTVMLDSDLQNRRALNTF